LGAETFPRRLERLRKNSTQVAQLTKSMPQGLKPALILQSLQRD
jgi:hypothetical protein